MSFKIDNELKDAMQQITNIMEQSERMTKISLDSIKLFETNIKNAEQKMESFITSMDVKQLKLSNLEKSIKSLEDLHKFVQTLDDDEKYIQHGPQGSLEEYIKRLENLKSFHKYHQTDNHLFKSRMQKLNVLLVEGERILMDEFKNVIKHYSSQETVTSFITYLADKDDFNSVNLNKNEQSNFLLYLPKETLHKLQTICTWFLIKEQDSELYNEKNQHCDIIEKLKYIDVRFEFIKSVIRWFLRIKNCDSSPSSPMGMTVNSSQQLFQTPPSLPHSASSSSFSKLNKLLHISDNNSSNNSQQNSNLQRSPLVNMRNKTKDSEKSIEIDHQRHSSNSSDRKMPSNNLTSLMIEESNKLLLNKLRNSTSSASVKIHKTRSLDCIDMFNDNLNFCLKILQHEKLIISYIFKKSDDTCNELLTSLAVLIIDEIQNELSLFLTQNIDFKKLSNNGPYVVQAIITLVAKVDMLKATSGLESNTMESSLRLLNFSSSLNTITSQILYYYLDTIKTGYFNHYQFPPDCSIHEFCESTCRIIRNIKSKEGVLDNALHLLCENFIDKTSSEESHDPNEPFRGRYRLKSNAFLEQQHNDNDKRLDYAKYFWLIIKRLNIFLIDEAIKSSTTSTSAITNISSTKNGIINLKAYVFLLNNLEYILETASELNLVEQFRLINTNFDNFINESIQKNCEKACDIFQDINLKWKTIVKQTETNQMMLESVNGTSEKRMSICSESTQLPSNFQAELNEQQQYVHNLSKIQSASTVAKKAFKSFKSAVLRPKSISDDVAVSDSEENNVHNDEANSVRATKFGSISMQGNLSNNAACDMTLLNITRNISELKKRRLALVQQLTTAIELSTKVVVINSSLNSRIKEIVRVNLNPVLDSLEQTGEIRGIIRKIFPNHNFTALSLKNQIFDEMFPNYKL
jgi:hypothetical protein